VYILFFNYSDRVLICVSKERREIQLQVGTVPSLTPSRGVYTNQGRILREIATLRAIFCCLSKLGVDQIKLCSLVPAVAFTVSCSST